MIYRKLIQNHVFKGDWDDLEARIGISIRKMVLEMGQIIFSMDSKFSEFSFRCAYISGFKRFSENDQKVHEMDKTEATVTSCVKNWYIIFFLIQIGAMGCQLVPKQ